jgi:hypothetical protein
MPVFGQSGRNSNERDLTTNRETPYRYQTKTSADKPAASSFERTC